MASEIVGRWLKLSGGRRLYDDRFKTKAGAARAGSAAAKKRGHGWVSLGPYWTGSYWTVRIAPPRKV